MYEVTVTCRVGDELGVCRRRRENDLGETDDWLTLSASTLPVHYYMK